MARAIGIAAVLLGLATSGALAATPAVVAGCEAEEARTAPAMDSIDLAVFHLDYLLLDEVIAGRGPAIAREIDLAIQRLAYLLLPEVMAGAAPC
jgi:hypothetical protein